MSNERKRTRSGTPFHNGQRQVVRVTSKKTIDVMPIVPVTAIPYAAARRLECSKLRTSVMHTMAIPQLTAGAYIWPSASLEVWVIITRGKKPSCTACCVSE